MLSTRALLAMLATTTSSLACGADSGVGDGETDASSSGSTGEPASVTASTTVAPTTTASTAASMSASGSTSATADDTAADESNTADSGEGSDDESSTGELGCDIDPLAPDTYVDIVLEHDGAMRSYNLYVPADFTGDAALPLVLNFHGFTMTAAQQQAFSLMDAAADAHGLAVAYPQGLGNSWNAGACCGSSMSGTVDDVGFALAVIADVKSRLCIDPQRVYATGMSNGGFMSHRLACDAADSFAAIAPVAGVLGIPFEDCNPARPVPVMHFHGTADPIVPYNGNGFGFVSVADTIAQWVLHDGCTGEASSVFDMEDAHCEAYDECTDGSHVELCTVENGGHCWPGNTDCPLMYSTDAISASDRMAEFFLGYTLP
jgi:polyhydroxybutyrate depolymerase